MTVLYTTVAIALMLASVAAHEWGHLDAMRRVGVDVEEYSLGFGPVFYARTLAGGLKVRLRMIPMGAFVRARDHKQVEALSARDNARFSGAGVWINVALGVALLGAGGLIGTGYRILPQVTLLAGGVAVWLLRRILGPWHLLLGAVAIALIVWTVLDPQGAMGTTTGPGTSVLSGPIELYKLLVASNPSDALVHGGAVSLTIGLVNSLPLPPLDGGHVAARFLRDHIGERAYRFALAAGVSLVLGCTALTLLHDVFVDVFGLRFL